MKDLQREHFSFSTKVFIGDFLKPTGKMNENGEEKYARLTEKEMYEDIDKLRRENGWKPRRRGSSTKSKTEPQTSKATTNNAASAASTTNNASDSASAAAAAQAVNAAAVAALLSASQGGNAQTAMAEALLKMQAQMQLASASGGQSEAANVRMQQEALR